MRPGWAEGDVCDSLPGQNTAFAAQIAKATTLPVRQ